jgi:hypothetical protein
VRARCSVESATHAHKASHASKRRGNACAHSGRTAKHGRALTIVAQLRLRIIIIIIAVDFDFVIVVERILAGSVGHSTRDADALVMHKAHEHATNTLQFRQIAAACSEGFRQSTWRLKLARQAADGPD